MAAKGTDRNWGGQCNQDQVSPCNLAHESQKIRLAHSTAKKIRLLAQKPARWQYASTQIKVRKRLELAMLAEACALRPGRMARPHSFCLDCILQWGVDFETLELEHNMLRNSRLIPVQFNCAALSRKQRKTRECLLACCGCYFDFLNAAEFGSMGFV